MNNRVLENMLKVERGDKVFPRKSVLPYAEFKSINHGESREQRQSFGQDNQYSLEMRIGVDFVANDVELPKRTERAEEMLIQALYKDAISGLHEIGSLSTDSDVQEKVYSLIDKLSGR